jgi:hypothetical protein
MGSVATPQDEDRGTGLGALLRLQVELWLVVVMMALAFGAGIVVTALYEEPQDQTAVVGTQLPSGQLVAPPLSDEQISQGLPSGHPDISGETGATGKDGAKGEGADAQGSESAEGTG